MDMEIEQSLAEKKVIIVEKWMGQFLETYESSSFFKKHKDPFANPIGSTVEHAFYKLFAVLHDGKDLEAAHKPLEDVVKIRAVQDFTPSQAVSFMVHLKTIIRDTLKKEGEQELIAELTAIEDKIDSMALMAFDIYMECRERLFKIRLNELNSGRYIITENARCPSSLAKNE
jgi:hypothetical protein